jgi:hypothetical protein
VQPVRAVIRALVLRQIDVAGMERNAFSPVPGLNAALIHE